MISQLHRFQSFSSCSNVVDGNPIAERISTSLDLLLRRAEYSASLLTKSVPPKSVPLRATRPISSPSSFLILIPSEDRGHRTITRSVRPRL